MQLTKPAQIQEAPLHLVETAVPQPTSRQIQIRISVCGVCHTDLHTVEGDLTLPKLPITPGHQAVGVVEAIGSKVTRHQIGDRVGVAWMYHSCGRCAYCRAGLENLCPDAQFTGFHADGGYAQFMVVDEQFAYPIPASFSDVHAAPLLCAGIVGFRALRLSGVQPGGRLGLYGFGASAHLAIQVARSWECEVYVFTRGREHRQHALALGAAWAGGAEDEPPHKLDGSVTFAPVGWIIPLALGHLRPGGTLAINAIHTSPIPEMPYHLIYGERVLRSVANFTRDDAETFLQTAEQIGIETTVSEYALADANEVLAALKRSEITGAAVLRM
ncbi:MAG: zinc-dependent alcohol dehydrogenase family protein [Anaerolineales bacterium]|nr:zinc-dependent alcohol dehydrogenase family protein [Anaerolineales bacterium]